MKKERNDKNPVENTESHHIEKIVCDEAKQTPSTEGENFVLHRKANYSTFNKFCQFCQKSKNIQKFRRGGNGINQKCNECSNIQKRTS